MILYTMTAQQFNAVTGILAAVALGEAVNLSPEDVTPVGTFGRLELSNGWEPSPAPLGTYHTDALKGEQS